ncbi:hypothetical protein NDU88_008189 [Pleurodeles waltl]|uniref:Uncharacterized protein n=1 Tax=Pleurodeles waltl TaxID=8319 RepID=A0AAV7N481_PLEWA|nr:hypothetical protein NDU88_008189 [Pleurodeles waltl]
MPCRTCSRGVLGHGCNKVCHLPHRTRELHLPSGKELGNERRAARGNGALRPGLAGAGILAGGVAGT